MNDGVNQNIKELCAKECFFENIKENCYSFIKEKFSTLFLSKKKSKLELAKIGESIQEYCTPHKNRKQIYMFVLTKEIDRHCKKNQKDNTGCLSHVFNKFENEFRRFDIEYDSAVFKQVTSKIKELIELYQQHDYSVDLRVLVETILVDSKKDHIEVGDRRYTEEKTSATINNYLKKIVTYYLTEKFDYKSRVALLDNALLHIEDIDTRDYFEEKFFNYNVQRIKNKTLVQPLLTVEEELMLYLDNDKEIASYMLFGILTEFIYKERFFSFINKRLPLRVIDFYRKNNPKSELEIRRKKVKKKLKSLRWSESRPNIMLLHYSYHYNEFIEPIIEKELTANINKPTISLADDEESEKENDDWINLRNSFIKGELKSNNNEEENSYCSIEDSFSEFDNDKKELLSIFYKYCSSAEITIMALKCGDNLNENIEEVLKTFGHKEILNLRGVIDSPLTIELEDKIENLKKALFESMVDKQGRILYELREDRVTLTSYMSYRIWMAEPISYKEISEIFGQEPKWASRKKNKISDRLNKGKK